MSHPELKYKGYLGQMTIDAEAGLIHGEVIGLRDVVTFQGETVAEAMQAFRDSVDDYLDFCKSLDRSPEKPFSGKFVVRVEPEVHRVLAMRAQVEGVSLNNLVSQGLSRLADPESLDRTATKAMERTGDARGGSSGATRKTAQASTKPRRAHRTAACSIPADKGLVTVESNAGETRTRKEPKSSSGRRSKAGTAK
ncbi:MAG TPA: type II toxin-antitoxin system HicB family antitoxin [Isosphaeraceae bacterium]|nr:type II toxin-antitoxin system HicB family antitoxin [Isosphaeraceae bacterium]